MESDKSPPRNGPPLWFHDDLVAIGNSGFRPWHTHELWGKVQACADSRINELREAWRFFVAVQSSESRLFGAVYRVRPEKVVVGFDYEDPNDAVLAAARKVRE